MSGVSRIVRTALVLLAGVFPSLSSSGQTSLKHAPRPASTGLRRHTVLPVIGKSTLTGVVREQATGNPIRSAALSVSDGQRFLTGEDGRFLFTLASRPVTIQVERVGFLPASKTLAAGAPLSLDFALDYAPAVVVKTASGETVILDLASSKFAYVQVFSGYINADTATLCKSDGSAFRPNKSDFVRIVGPAVPATSACCDRGPSLKANAEMKNGDKLPVYFVDSCYGYEVDFLGIERTSGMARYFNFTDVAEISFP